MPQPSPLRPGPQHPLSSGLAEFAPIGTTKPELSPRNRAALVIYLAMMATLSVVFFVRPSWHIVIWCLMGLITAAAIIRGVAAYRPSRWMPWLLIAAAMLVFTFANSIYHVLDLANARHPFPSSSHAYYLVIYPLLAAGLFGLAGSVRDRRDSGTLLDILTFACGVGLLVWLFLVAPRVHSTDLTGMQQGVAAGYPLGDIILLGRVS